MGLLILFGLIGLPLAEIAAFVAVGGRIGVLATLALVVLTFLAGLVVLRLQGLTMAVEVRQALARDELPGRALFDGACRVLAGLLLMLPGFVSDGIAVLLLLSPVRSLLFGWIARRISAHGSIHVHRSRYGRGTVIEGEYDEVDPEAAADAPPRLPGDRERNEGGRR